MGTVYARGRQLWIGYKDVTGKWVYARTDFVVGQEEKARKVVEVIERRIEAGRALGEAELGPTTLQRYFERWIADRRSRGLASVPDDESRLGRHVMPRLGGTVLREIRPLHIRSLVRELAARCGPGEDQLAPRTVRNIYGVLHRLFEDAVADELIDANPCVLKRGELPAKVDKDPTWRAGAVYTREEVEQLISDERIPEDRRVLYALIFLAGLRFGEAAACRWRAYDATATPLGKLLVASSFSTRRRVEKGVKTERPREVPVHRTLAKALATWRDGGWERMLGRPPGPEDLVIPTREGRHRRANHSLRRMHEDCERLGLRARRQHDARRTMISLAQADGARKDILRWVTHGPEGDIVSVYTTLPWASLCEEVGKLKIGLRGDSPAGAAKPAASQGEAQVEDGALTTSLLQTQRAKEKPPSLSGTWGLEMVRGVRDLNTQPVPGGVWRQHGASHLVCSHRGARRVCSGTHDNQEGPGESRMPEHLRLLSPETRGKPRGVWCGGSSGLEGRKIPGSGPGSGHGDGKKALALRALR